MHNDTDTIDPDLIGIISRILESSLKESKFTMAPEVLDQTVQGLVSNFYDELSNIIEDLEYETLQAEYPDIDDPLGDVILSVENKPTKSSIWEDGVWS